MKRTVSKWLSILSCTALLCTSIPAAFAEGTVEESLVPVTGAQTGFVLSQGKYYTDFANLAQERAAAALAQAVRDSTVCRKPRWKMA